MPSPSHPTQKSEAQIVFLQSGGSVERLDLRDNAQQNIPLTLQQEGQIWPGESSVVVFSLDSLDTSFASTIPDVNEIDTFPSLLDSPMPPAETEINTHAALMQERTVCVSGQQEASGFAIFFMTGSATLGPKGRAAVQEVAALYKAGAASRLTVTGYASADGSSQANLNLSARRAVTVAKALSAHGVPFSSLMVRAYGPVRGDVKRAQAQRVDIAFTDSQGNSAL